MKLYDLEIVIENIRGSYKKFVDTLDEYPVLGVTFPTHYGYIEGYIGEDKHDLDVFIGNGELLGYIKFKRDDVEGGLETKMFLNVSENELNAIIEAYKPVVNNVVRFNSEDDFMSFIKSFKNKKLSLVSETALYMGNIDETRKFYVGILGLDVIKDDSPTGRDIFLRCGRTGVFLFNAEQTKIPSSEVPSHGVVGAGHMAFGVPAEDLESWKQHLIKNNIEIEKEVYWKHKGTNSIYFRDPSGNSLEFISLDHWGL